jgi:hypothetical protein
MHISHVTIGVDGRIAPFNDTARRHQAVRRLVRRTRKELALFNIVPDHVHLAHAHQRPVDDFRRAASICLRCAASTPVERTRCRPVRDVEHARSLIRYILGQCAHHDLPEDDALWTGSSFQDLVGARWIEGWRPPLLTLDARFRMRDALSAVGLPEVPIAPVSLDQLHDLGAARLQAAAVAALAADPELTGNRRPEALARVAVAKLGLEAELGASELRRVLSVELRSVFRLANRGCPQPALNAVRVRLGLELAVASARAHQALRELRRSAPRDRQPWRAP